MAASASDYRDSGFRDDLVKRVLSADLRARIHPIQMRKASIVVRNMQVLCTRANCSVICGC